MIILLFFLILIIFLFFYYKNFLYKKLKKKIRRKRRKKKLNKRKIKNEIKKKVSKNNVKDDTINKKFHHDKNEQVKEIAEQAGVMIGRDLLVKGIEKGVKKLAEKEAEKSAEKLAEKEAAELAEKEAEKEATKLAEKEAEKAAEKAAEKQAEKEAEKEAAKTARELAEKEAEEAAEKAAAKEAEKEAAKVAEREAEIEAEKEAARAARKLAEKEAAKAAEKAAEKEAEKEAAKEAERLAVREAEKAAEKAAEKEAERLAAKEAAKVAEKAAEKIAEKEAEKIAEKLAEEAAAESAGEAVTVAATEAALGPAGWALLAFDVISIGLDIWDPNDYKSFKSNEYWSKISNNINKSWKNNIKKVNKKYLKDYKEGKKKVLIQIEDPKVVGPLEKLSKRKHQEYLKSFIEDYQKKNIKRLIKEFHKTLSKKKVNKMLHKYIEKTDFTKLIKNFNNLKKSDQKRKILILFQGGDNNSPMNKEMTKFIENRLTSYMNSKKAKHDLTRFSCNKTGKGRFIESGFFKGKCTYKSKSLCDGSYDWNKIKNKDDGTYAKYYDTKNKYKFKVNNKSVSEKNICLSAGWESQIRKLCENNKKKNGKREPLIYNPITNSCDATPSYCKDYGMDYHDDKNGKYCKTTTGQKVGEFLLGSTIYRAIKKAIEKDKECTTDGVCKTKYGNRKPACINYKCQKKNPVGKGCWRDSHCKSGVCVSAWTRISKGNAAFEGACKECWSNKECKGNKICTNYKCINALGYRSLCLRSDQCAGNLVCKGLDGCRYENYTRKTGEKCAFNLECKSGHCNVPDGKGWKCGCYTNKDCKGNLACIDYKCKRKKGYRYQCARSDQCSGNLVCKGLDGCRYKNHSRKTGEKCAFNVECKSSHCNIRDGRGGWKCGCASNKDCKGAKGCFGYVCKDKLGYRQLCLRTDQCKDHLVCKGLDGCRYKDKSRNIGQSCAFSAECKRGTCCSGKCKYKIKDYAGNYFCPERVGCKWPKKGWLGKCTSNSDCCSKNCQGFKPAHTKTVWDSCWGKCHPDGKSCRGAAIRRTTCTKRCPLKYGDVYKKKYQCGKPPICASYGIKERGFIGIPTKCGCKTDYWKCNYKYCWKNGSPCGTVWSNCVENKTTTVGYQQIASNKFRNQYCKKGYIYGKQFVGTTYGKCSAFNK